MKVAQPADPVSFGPSLVVSGSNSPRPMPLRENRSFLLDQGGDTSVNVSTMGMTMRKQEGDTSVANSVAQGFINDSTPNIH